MFCIDITISVFYIYIMLQFLGYMYINLLLRYIKSVIHVESNFGYNIKREFTLIFFL